MNKLMKIFNRGTQLFTTSKEIERVTGKEHKHVLRDIREIENEYADITFFRQTTYKDKNNRTYPMYEVTEKGLTLYLCNMQGYVKEKASYINEFERMKIQLEVIAKEDRELYEKSLKKSIEIANNKIKLIEEEKAVYEDINNVSNKFLTMDDIIITINNGIKDVKLHTNEDEINMILARAGHIQYNRFGVILPTDSPFVLVELDDKNDTSKVHLYHRLVKDIIIKYFNN